MVLALVVAVTAAGAVLAVGSGLAKLARPLGAGAALRAVGLPSSTNLVRAGSLGEASIGVAALVSASWIARLALCVVYVALATFIVASLRAGSPAPCGCFGEGETPMSVRHLAFTCAFATAAAASLLVGVHPSRLLAGLPAATGVTALVLAVATAALSATLMARPRDAS